MSDIEIDKGKENRRRPKKVKRTQEQYDRDIAIETDYFLKGYTYRAIADYINKLAAHNKEGYTISHVTVFDDMQKQLIEWKKQQYDNIDKYVTQELAKLEKMEAELWQAWEASKRGKSKKTKRNDQKPVKKTDDDETKILQWGFEQESFEDTLGDPRYMDLLLNLQQRRAKLLGYDAPVKVQPVMPDREGEELGAKYNISLLPSDMLFAIVDKLQDSKFQNINQKSEAVNDGNKQ